MGSGLSFKGNPKTLWYKKKAMSYYYSTPAIKARKLLRKMARKYPECKDDLQNGLYWAHPTMCTWDKQIIDHCNNILRYEGYSNDLDKKIRLLQLQQFQSNCEYDCSENHEANQNLSYLAEVAQWQAPLHVEEPQCSPFTEEEMNLDFNNENQYIVENPLV